MSKSYDIERTSQGFDIEEAGEVIDDMLAALEMLVSLPDAMTALARAFPDRWQEARAAIAKAKVGAA